MTTIRIAGVPEHFNLPWQLAIKKGDFAARGIDLQWTNVPEGTGKLAQMLRTGDTDLAVILTEGIVKDIVVGNPSKIVQVYVESPLLWGIHVAADSQYRDLSDLQNTVAAISREGSGSQLMAYVNAHEQGWKDDNLKFEIVHTIDGAVTALQNGSADYFMWEKFMTKPLVDGGIFRRLGDCPTPWPSFVVVASDSLIKARSEAVHTILDVINENTKVFKEIPGIDVEIASTFGQKISDVQQWLSLTSWSQNSLNEETLNIIQNQLADLGIIDKKGTFAEIVGG
jgi:ABC-type nitrate/sulfonate/bicarbonate transport system substrate-binding protein